MSVDELNRLLACWVREGLLAEFDRHWVGLLRRLDPGAPPPVLLAAALARAAIDQGHLCLELEGLNDRSLPWPEGAAPFTFPPPAALRQQLAASRLVTGPEGDGAAPLVLENNRLYLRRYQQYEQELAAAVRQLSARPPAGRKLAASLQSLTAAAGLSLDPQQQRAVLTALDRCLTVISGGPGTGKTTIIFFVLALVRHLAAESGRPAPQILLLAPTGKAAARLGEAISRRPQEPGRLDTCQVMTIHRALGYQHESPTIFRHRADNPLAADLVVVDEASMVDVALMSKLFAAVPPGAQLLLLGDKDQLASVEAGSILGDICLAASRPGSPLAGGVVTLERGFRFDPRRGIGALTRAIRAGEPEAVLAALQDDLAGEVTWHNPADLEQDRRFRELVVAGFGPCLAAATAEEALRHLGDFRLLCAHRRGREGAETLNHFCRGLLAAAGWLRPDGEWYRGRPIMVTANDYALRLFNGDLGLIWDSPEDGGQLRAFFPESDGRMRRLLPGRLPRHETAFAMTIHKSQGSEFGQVAVVLPRDPSPLLTRELLYTAVSRARQQVHLFASPEIISRAVTGRVQRASGLADRL